MDKAKFEKIKLWGSIIVAVLCYFMFACLSYESIKEHQDFLVALLFLVFAINCTYRIRAHYKLERKRKSAFSEKEVAKAERSQGIASAVFSNATAGIYMLFMTAPWCERQVYSHDMRRRRRLLYRTPAHQHPKPQAVRQACR